MILPTAYLPPTAYLAEIFQEDGCEVEACETYKKQTCRNHCDIYGPNGLQTLRIPVIKTSGNHTLTKDIRISYRQPWQLNHWRSIETAYNNAPFFIYYKDFFEPFFRKETGFLLDFNTQILMDILQLLKSTCMVTRTQEFNRGNHPEQREAFVSKKRNFPHPSYLQPFTSSHGFIDNLSIIDTLFNLGPDTPEYLNRFFTNPPQKINGCSLGCSECRINEQLTNFKNH
ncbi:MAG: WbqC family protein [Bacteroidales bacterium]|nr:WbqC family protein [Bacteroidales bacterium]